MFAILLSLDLRRFFSAFIEDTQLGFLCFHFRHRPEKLLALPEKMSKTCSCIVKLALLKADTFKAMFHGKLWNEKEASKYSHAWVQAVGNNYAFVNAKKNEVGSNIIAELRPPLVSFVYLLYTLQYHRLK